MNLVMVKYMLIGVFILTTMVIIGTRKFKNSKGIEKASTNARKKCIILIANLWKKQAIMSAISVTLILIVVLIENTGTEIAKTSISLISQVFILVSSILTMTNYNRFKREYYNAINKIEGEGN